MSWSQRYGGSVTRKSIREVTQHLPEGWEIKGIYSSPTNKRAWFPRSQTYTDGEGQEQMVYPESVNDPRRQRRPDSILLHNPTTGNHAIVLDHSDMYRGTGKDPERASRVKSMWNNTWNFGMHGEHICTALQHLDSVTSGTTLNFGRDPSSAEKYRTNTSIGGYYRFSPNSRMINMGTGPFSSQFSQVQESGRRTTWHPEGVIDPKTDPLQVKATINRELGHMFSSRDNDVHGEMHKYKQAVSQLAGILCNRHSYVNNPEFDPFNRGSRTDAEDFAKKYHRARVETIQSGNPDPEKWYDKVRTLTANCGYGRRSWHEHYAEMFAQYVHPTAPKSHFLKLLGKHMDWDTALNPTSPSSPGSQVQS